MSDKIRGSSGFGISVLVPLVNTSEQFGIVLQDGVFFFLQTGSCVPFFIFISQKNQKNQKNLPGFKLSHTSRTSSGFE